MLINSFGIRKLNGKRAKRTADDNLSNDCKYDFKKWDSDGSSTQYIRKTQATNNISTH